MTGTALTEDQFQTRVLHTAKTYGWLVFHPLKVHTRRGVRTPTQGDKGFPDLVMARNGVVLIVELKRDNTYPTPEQRAWHTAMGEHCQIWRPRDWDRVLAILKPHHHEGAA